MPYEEVARAQVSSAGVQGDIYASLTEIPVGTEGIIHLQGFGAGKAFDLPLAEQIAQAVFNLKGIDITVKDCYGEGWNDGYIEFKGSPVAIVPLLGAIAVVMARLSALLIPLGIFIIILTVSVLIWKAGAGAPASILTLALVGGLVLGGLYLAGKGRVRA